MNLNNVTLKSAGLSALALVLTIWIFGLGAVLLAGVVGGSMYALGSVKPNKALARRASFGELGRNNL